MDPAPSCAGFGGVPGVTELQRQRGLQCWRCWSSRPGVVSSQRLAVRAAWSRRSTVRRALVIVTYRPVRVMHVVIYARVLSTRCCGTSRSGGCATMGAHVTTTPLASEESRRRLWRCRTQIMSCRRVRALVYATPPLHSPLTPPRRPMRRVHLIAATIAPSRRAPLHVRSPSQPSRHQSCTIRQSRNCNCATFGTTPHQRLSLR